MAAQSEKTRAVGAKIPLRIYLALKIKGKRTGLRMGYMISQALDEYVRRGA